MAATHSYNNTTLFFNNFSLHEDFNSGSPFQYLSVGILFSVLYAIVFLACIAGNGLVVFVIVKHRRMRNITNFFLANLAVSDFCVGVFCIIPNLIQFLTPYWYAGRVMCKLYFFIQCVSYTSSIIILTVISMERYFAIIHPMLSRRLSRMTLMRVILVIVWLLAVAYGIPSLIAYDTVDTVEDDRPVAFCYAVNMKLHIFIYINFVLWYCVPLLLISAMYTQISIVLWKSSFMAGAQAEGSGSTRYKSEVTCEISEHPTQVSSGNHYESKQPLVKDKSNGRPPSPNSLHHQDNIKRSLSKQESDDTHVSASKKLRNKCSTKNALIARRKVIRLLISIVACFALCMLPHHIRLLYSLMKQETISTAYFLGPPLTFWTFYLNSALNPILYAFLSDNFRKSLKEVFGCGRREMSWVMKSGTTKGTSVKKHNKSGDKPILKSESSLTSPQYIK